MSPRTKSIVIRLNGLLLVGGFCLTGLLDYLFRDVYPTHEGLLWGPLVMLLSCALVFGTRSKNPVPLLLALAIGFAAHWLTLIATEGTAHTPATIEASVIDRAWPGNGEFWQLPAFPCSKGSIAFRDPVTKAKAWGCTPATVGWMAIPGAALRVELLRGPFGVRVLSVGGLTALSTKPE